MEKSPYFKEVSVNHLGVASEHKPNSELPIESMQSVIPTQQKPLSRIEEIRLKYPRAGKLWSNVEDAELVKGSMEGLMVPDLAKNINGIMESLMTT